MKKGIGALEIIFGMFILIIVVLVLIRMFTAIVTPKKITEQLENFESAYQITAEKAACNQACDSYLDNGCSRKDAVDFCLKKIKIDIDGNKIPGERYHGNFVRNLPYCEDGLYCFHIFDCSCGNYRLTAENCLKILCDYYQFDEGLPTETAISLISDKNNGVFWGTCDKDPKNWIDYAPPTSLQADWWWNNAGYKSVSCSNIVTGSQESGVKLECSSTGNKIKCEWSGCATGQGKQLVVALKKGSDDPITCKLEESNPSSSGNCEILATTSGNYLAILTCSGTAKSVNVAVG